MEEKKKKNLEVLTSILRQVMNPVFSVGGLGACNWCGEFQSKEERQVPKFDVCSMCFQCSTSMMPAPYNPSIWCIYSFHEMT